MEEIGILYKYRSWTSEFDKKVISNNEFFLSPPSIFNDPFDCSFFDRIELLDTDLKLEQYAERKLLSQLEFIRQNDLDFDHEKQKLINRIQSNPTKFQDELDNVYFKKFDRDLGILSFSKKWDSILMWSHYSDNHKGYCVGVNGDKLLNKGFFTSGGPVIYNESNDIPILDPLDDDLNKKYYIQSHNKANDWRYEEEYRFVKLFYPKSPEVSDRKFIIVDSDFSEIVLGLKISEKDKNEIVSIAKSKKIKVYQAIKVRNKFSLDRKLII